MKKLALTIILFGALLVGFDSNAQRKDSGYDKGNFLINGGFSVGYFFDTYYGNVSFPGVIGSAEWSVHEWVGVGPYIGFRGYSDGTTIAIGARGTFHYGQFIPSLNTKMLDLYGTLHVGPNIHHFGRYYPDGRDYNYTSFVFGPVAGARWFPTQGGFGIFGEVGYGPLGFLTLGVSGKF